MGAELSKIKIGASLVTNVHALSELALAPKSIEDDGIDGDRDSLDDDFDDAANKRPLLHAADQSISDVVLEELTAFVVFAAPAPNVLTITIVSTAVQDGGTHSPHDDAESKEEDCKDSVVDSSFFGAFVASPPIGVEDAEGKDQRDAGNGQQQDLRPWLGIGRPGRQAVSGGKRFGGVEDHEGSGNQGENDQRAGEVNATEHHLGHPDSGLDFLRKSQYWLEKEDAFLEAHEIFGLFPFCILFMLLEDLFFPECGAQWIEHSSWRSWSLQSRLQWRCVQVLIHGGMLFNWLI